MTQYFIIWENIRDQRQFASAPSPSRHVAEYMLSRAKEFDTVRPVALITAKKKEQQCFVSEPASAFAPLQGQLMTSWDGWVRWARSLLR